jgi:hypothetical protein
LHFSGNASKYFMRTGMEHMGNWKIVCEIEIRGRRGDYENEAPDLHYLHHGIDRDFLGLHVNV